MIQKIGLKLILQSLSKEALNFNGSIRTFLRDSRTSSDVIGVKLLGNVSVLNASNNQLISSANSELSSGAEDDPGTRTRYPRPLSLEIINPKFSRRSGISGGKPEPSAR